MLPVIEALAARVQVPISIDTYKASTADAALAAGASLVNDVSGLRYEPDLAAVVARHGVPIVLMHTRGRSRDMYQQAVYSRRRRRSARRAAREHRVCRRRRHSQGTHAGGPRSRLRQGSAPQLRGAGAACTSSPSSAGRSWSDPRARRSSPDRSRAARWTSLRATGRPRPRSRPPCSAVRTSCASTRCARWRRWCASPTRFGSIIAMSE